MCQRNGPQRFELWIEKAHPLPQSGSMWRYGPFAALLAFSLLAGCEKESGRVPSRANAGSPPTNPVPPSIHLNEALPRLTTMKLWLGPKELSAELAIMPRELATGMMFRREMGENEGMLFIFGRPLRASFYMKNTYIPLSCAYIDPEGAILEIHDLVPLDETPVEAKTDQVQYVLEVKQGWFERNGVKTGMVVRTEGGSLRDTFFRRNKTEP